MMSGGVFDRFIDAFDVTGVRLIVPDYRGTGASSKPETGYSLERNAADMAALLAKEVRGRCVLVAHSMGGQIGALVAADAPGVVSGLAMLCPVPPKGLPFPPDAIELFRSCGEDRDKQGIILDLACKDLSAADRQQLPDVGATVSVPCIQENFEAFRRGGIEARMKDIEAKTVVVASEDPFLPVELLRAEVAAAIRRSRLVVIPGAGHYVQVERARESAAGVGAFVAGRS